MVLCLFVMVPCRMVDAADLRAVKADLAHLSARVEELFQWKEKRDEVCLGQHETIYGFIDILDSNAEHIFERLLNLEKAVFPNLLQGLAELHPFIKNGDDKAHQPLDRRPLTPPRKPPQ